MRFFVFVTALAGFFLFANRVAGEGEVTEEVLEAYLPHMAKVQYHLCYHQGDEPRAPGLTEQCTGCGRYHINRASSALREERPAEFAGIVISPSQVISFDPLLHSRFIEKVTVEIDGTVHEAVIDAYSATRPAIRLRLLEPLSDISEMEFDRSEDTMHYILSFREIDGEWLLRGTPLSLNPGISAKGNSMVAVRAPSLVIDDKGNPVTITVQTLMPSADWDAPPQSWDWLDAEAMADLVEQTSRLADEAIVRVMLNFRTPLPLGNAALHMHSFDKEITELSVPGVILRDGRILVLAELTPRTTARLERIRVFFEREGEEASVDAEFLASLHDVGALVAKLDSPPVPGLTMQEADAFSLRGKLLPSVDVTITGNQRIAWASHTRISSLHSGWRNQIMPDMRGSGEATFAFDKDGRLLLLPVSRRDRSASARNHYRQGSGSRLTFSGYLMPVLDDLSAHTDTANIPLGEDEEGRLAWLGAELQTLTEEMAKLAGVRDTLDHGSGAMVAYVYPDSPAERIGIESGMVLLRLRIPGQPQPIRIEVQEDYFSGHPFPWDQLDDIPPEYMDRIPRPWPTAASPLNQSLTEIGFGTDVTLEVFHEDELSEKHFSIEEGPRHFDIAPRYESDTLGVTVRDLTYELRRFFRRPEGEPGVILSRVVPGARAATAGLRPYEIITHVNDIPVHNTEEFQQSLEDGHELRLAVRRMARGRVVKVSLPEGEANSETTEE